MKINIVCPDMPKDTILYRLADMLAEHTGWTINKRPYPNHDLNYDIIYIDWAQNFTDWRQTPWAAYFSHYEAGTPYKEFWWKMAAEGIKIRTVTSETYKVMLGDAIKICPPIDPQFVPIDRKRNDIPKIGVSGFVDKSGRKGEKLLARLAGALDDQADFIGAGRGWPVKSQLYKFDELPRFYNSLDVYVCTSMIEGIPMPPLEALACGVPVVIPVGVGMLDDLPDKPGVYRYPAGDYDSLQIATQAAMNDQTDRETLASYVKDYTPANFAKNHVDGFRKALDSMKANVSRESDAHGRRGVYYVAFGDPARECARGAISSLRKFLPDIPVALASDRPLGGEDVFIEMPDIDIGGRAAKIQIYDKAPKEWQYVAYLDADTEIIAAETFLWDILSDGWDMVICKNPGRFAVASAMRRSDNNDECEETYRKIGTEEVLQLNGGVFAFQRNARTKAFFRAWYKEWQRYGKRDQAALLRALWMHPVKLYVLGNEWNTITRYDHPDTAAWLLHYPMTARRWRGVIHYRLDDPGAWDAVRQFEAGR